MLRQIAMATGTSAQVLRAFNRRTLNTPTERLADSRTDDVDELIADQAHALEEEHRRLYDERLSAMMEENR